MIDFSIALVAIFYPVIALLWLSFLVHYVKTARQKTAMEGAALELEKLEQERAELVELMEDDGGVVVGGSEDLR